MHEQRVAPGAAELVGERALLSPLEAEHFDGLLAAAQAPEIWTWMPLDLRAPAALRSWLETSLSARESGRELPYTIIDRSVDRIVGSTRFLDIDPANYSLEIGWTWLNPSVWRTRVNTECKLLLLTCAFEMLGAIRVQLKTDARNTRSQQAVERIGGVKEGVLRHHRVLPDGYRRDSVYYSILQSEWPEVRARIRSLLERSRQDVSP